MYFRCRLQVIIANKIVNTICRVTTKNESTHIGSECDIQVPLNCRIEYIDGKGGNYLTAYPQVLFNVGDPVSVRAWYDGYPTIKVFDGFVTDFNYGMPMTIRCSDYIYNLNQGTINIVQKTITLKNLCDQILKGTGVSLMLPVFDLTLSKITFNAMSPAAILEYIKKEIGLNISLQGNQLYVNVASNTLNTVHHYTDRNVLKADLQKPNTIFNNYRVKCWFVTEQGVKDSVEVGNTSGRVRDFFFYRIPRNNTIYQKLAVEALNKVKQEKYSGHIETLLYPDCNLFDKAVFKSVRYPGQNANFVITGMDFDIGHGGFHRKIKYSYLSETA